MTFKPMLGAKIYLLRLGDLLQQVLNNRSVVAPGFTVNIHRLI